MKVAMYYNNQDVRIEEIERPQIGSDELLVKVFASGICGSDVMEWYRVKKAPLVLGHEITGQIVEVGKNVENYKVGDRVFVSHHVPCNTCHHCLNGHHTACETLHTTNYYPGGFAEYIRVPSINVDRGVFLLPKEVTFSEGALIEPLACVVRGQRVASFKPGQTVLILGAGLSGLIHLLSAQASGAGQIVITDIEQYRLQAAKDLGANSVINAKEDIASYLQEINGRLADLVIVCTTALTAFQQALQCVDKGGTILMFAPTKPDVLLPIPVEDFWRKEIKIVHSYGNAPSDAQIAIELIRAGRVTVKRLITHKLSLDQAPLGFQLVAQAKECLKVIIEPQKKEV